MSTTVSPWRAGLRVASVAAVLFLTVSDPAVATEDPRRRPGTYTVFEFAKPGPFDNFTAFMTWESAPETGWIYPALQLAFACSGGYIGTQLVGEVRTAIFSIWDCGSDDEDAVPAHANCVRFGHEGSGSSCIIPYEWVTGREYRVRVEATSLSRDGQTWRGTVRDTATGTETIIGEIRLANQPGSVGFGGLTGALNFLEYFGGPESCGGNVYSKVSWRGPFANDGDVAPTKALASYPPCRTNNVSSAGCYQATHEGGDGANKSTPDGTDLWAGFDCAPDADIAPPSIELSMPEIVRTALVPLEVLVGDRHGIASYYLSEVNEAPEQDDPRWSVEPPTSFQLSNGDGAKVVFGWAKDAAGNISTPASASVFLDSTAPVVSITAPADGARLRQLAEVSGIVRDADGSGPAAVLVAIRRRVAPGQCEYWTGKGWAGRECRDVVWFRLAARDPWKLRRGFASVEFRRPGTYAIVCSAIDLAGNRSARELVPGVNWIRFRLE